MKALALLAGGALALGLQAARADAVDPAVAAVCEARPAPAGAADFDVDLVAQPGRALDQACLQWRGATPPQRLTAAVDVALALAHLDDRAPPGWPALLAALRAAPIAQTGVERAALVQAYAAADYQRAAAGLQAQRDALQASGQAGSLAMLELCLIEARVVRKLRLAGWVERAEAALDEATRSLQPLGHAQDAWAGEVYNARSLHAHARDDIPAALVWAERELEVGRAGGDSLSLIDTYNNIASYQHQLHDYDAAGRTWQQALDLVARHPEASADVRAGVHANHAVFLFLQGRWHEALGEAGRADDIARAAWGEQSPRRVEALTRVAESQWMLGRLRDALRTLDQALAIAQPARANVGGARLMRLHEVRAQVLAGLGQVDAAQRALDDGLAEDRRGDLRYWQARSQWKRAGLLALRRDWPAAEAALAEAEPLLAGVVGARNPWVQQLTSQRCVVQLRGGAAGEACERLRAAPERADEIPYHRAERLAALAQAAQLRGEDALDLRLAALAAARHVQGPTPLWRAAAEVARLLRAGGHRELAVLLGKQAVQALQLLRRDAAADTLGMEQDFLADKREVYEAVADWLTEDGRLAEALAVLSLLKEQELHEFTRGAGLQLRAGAGPVLPFTAAEQREQAGWATQASETLPTRPNGVMATSERELGRRLLAAEAQQVQQWREALAALPASASAPAGADAPLPREARPARGVLRVHAYVLGPHLNLVLDSAAGRRLLRRELPAGELDRRIGHWLGALSARRDDAVLTAYFSELLGRPVRLAAEAAGARRLELVLSGNLRYLPWAALDSGAGPLGARLAIEHAGRGAVAAPARQARLQVLANTRGGAGEAPLPALAQEVCAIVDGPAQGWDAGDPPCAGRGALPGRAWVNAAFTRTRLADSVASTRGGGLLHLASHFRLQPGLMSASWLLLGDGTPLPLPELAALDFHGQSLVTLSACETGLGGGDGAELEGLNQTLLRRGAARVLASLWRVDDRSTAALMAAFYRALAAGRTPAEALADAQARLRADPRWAAPFHWAAFYLAS